MQLNTLLAALHRERLERAAQKGALLTNENTQEKKEKKKATDVKVAELSSHPISDCEVQADVNAPRMSSLLWKSQF